MKKMLEQHRKWVCVVGLIIITGLVSSILLFSASADGSKMGNINNIAQEFSNKLYSSEQEEMYSFCDGVRLSIDINEIQSNNVINTNDDGTKSFILAGTIKDGYTLWVNGVKAIYRLQSKNEPDGYNRTFSAIVPVRLYEDSATMSIIVKNTEKQKVYEGDVSVQFKIQPDKVHALCTGVGVTSSLTEAYKEYQLIKMEDESYKLGIEFYAVDGLTVYCNGEEVVFEQYGYKKDKKYSNRGVGKAELDVYSSVVPVEIQVENENGEEIYTACHQVKVELDNEAGYQLTDKVKLITDINNVNYDQYIYMSSPDDEARYYVLKGYVQDGYKIEIKDDVVDMKIDEGSTYAYDSKYTTKFECKVRIPLETDSGEVRFKLVLTDDIDAVVAQDEFVVEIDYEAIRPELEPEPEPEEKEGEVEGEKKEGEGEEVESEEKEGEGEEVEPAEKKEDKIDKVKKNKK